MHLLCLVYVVNYYPSDYSRPMFVIADKTVMIATRATHKLNTLCRCDGEEPVSIESTVVFGPAVVIPPTVVVDSPVMESRNVWGSATT